MKIRVLELLASLRRAGAETVAVSLACRLDPARFETAVVSLYDPFPDGLEPLLEERGIRAWHLGKRRGFDPRMYPRLLRLFRQFHPDVLHTHSYVLRYALPPGLAARVPLMLHTVHNLAAREVDALGRAVHRLAFRCGVRPVAITAQLARSFREVYGSEPAAVIPNGIDADRYSRPETRQRWRRAHGFAEDDLLIVSVARLEPQKNPLGLIESFAQALAGDQRCHLLLAGDGSLRDAARERAGCCGVAARVHFLGARADVPDLLAASDLFALASLWEGSPIAVMEAMAAGLPVAATAVGGVPELVQDGATGILAPAGDNQALARALAALARDPQRRGELGRAAAARSARFSLTAMVESYSALFESLLGVRR